MEMKEFKVKSNVGLGLFEFDSVPTMFRFPNGDELVLNLHAMTQDVVVALELEGVKFSEYESNSEALEMSQRIIRRLVDGGMFKGKELDEKQIGRITSNLGLTESVIEACRALAEETVETSEGNSET